MTEQNDLRSALEPKFTIDGDCFFDIHVAMGGCIYIEQSDEATGEKSLIVTTREAGVKLAKEIAIRAASEGAEPVVHPPVADAADVAVEGLKEALDRLDFLHSKGSLDDKVREEVHFAICAIDAAIRPPAAEPAGLREAVERFIADVDDADRAEAGTNPLMLAHIKDFRAAIRATCRFPSGQARFGVEESRTTADSRHE